jgi:hypothetical protein
MGSLPEHIEENGLKYPGDGGLLPPHIEVNGGLLKYPDARRDESVREVYHKTEIADPYRWYVLMLFFEPGHSLIDAYMGSRC